jgi:hypothetical protein
MNSDLTSEKLKEHLGHTVAIVSYGLKNDSGELLITANVALECEDCSMVLADCDM